MRTEKRKIEWDLNSGGIARITLTLRVGRDLGTDGWGNRVVKEDEADINVESEVARDAGGWTACVCVSKLAQPIRRAGKTYVAACGRLLLATDVYNRYLAALAELEATPEYQADQAARERGRKAAKAYQDNHDAVTRAMNM